MFPNPASASLTLRFLKNQTKEVQIELTDQLGRILMKEKRMPQHNTLMLDIHSLPAGVYMLKLTDEHSGKSWIEKVVKE
ncbi:hypothetical protein EMGBS15_06750 [Filimonas sp.]|nr:hypothetical protein EMGBS15_06750 [Filimonas sp.]